jgi:hypothetical protein
MDTDVPYLMSVTNLHRILDQMQKAGVPENFNRDFLKDLGFGASGDRPMVKLLKYLGFLDGSGRPTSFYREFMDHTKAKKVLTTIKYWKDHFKNSEDLRLQQFGKHLKKGHVYSTKTSPFIALSLAFNAGATDIILFGVELKNHPVIKGKLLNYELRHWEKFCRLLSEYKVNVRVSSEESVLSKFLPVWKTERDSILHLAQ